MISDEPLGRRPDNRVAPCEDLAGLLLDGWVGEELVQAIHAVPDVQDQELAGAFAVWLHRDMYHMTDIPQGLGGCHIGGCAGGRIVGLAGCLHRLVG